MNTLADWRLWAVDLMWQATLEIRERSGSLILLDILRPSEYQDLVTRSDLRPQLLSEEDATKIGAVEIERTRPFVSDELFRLVFLYRAMRARMCIVLAWGVRNGCINPWFEDDGLKFHLGNLLSAQEMAEFEASNPPRVQLVTDLVEQKILAEIKRMIVSD